jgi:hypothetical protein
MSLPIRAARVLVVVIAASIAPPLAAPVAAQATAQQPPAHPLLIPVAPARAEDVASIDAIIAALYDVISGPAGQARDWNRMRSLFMPGARLIPTANRPGDAVGVRVMEVNDYIAMSGAFLERVGFTEREIARRTDEYAHIAHVFSTYEGHMETEPTVIRGINSIQLLNDGTRWWILSVYWEQESPSTPLPAHYLPR